MKRRPFTRAAALIPLLCGALPALGQAPAIRATADLRLETQGTSLSSDLSEYSRYYFQEGVELRTELRPFQRRTLEVDLYGRYFQLQEVGSERGHGQRYGFGLTLRILPASIFPMELSASRDVGDLSAGLWVDRAFVANSLGLSMRIAHRSLPNLAIALRHADYAFDGLGEAPDDLVGDARGQTFTGYQQHARAALLHGDEALRVHGRYEADRRVDAYAEGRERTLTQQLVDLDGRAQLAPRTHLTLRGLGRASEFGTRETTNDSRSFSALMRLNSQLTETVTGHATYTFHGDSTTGALGHSVSGLTNHRLSRTLTLRNEASLGYTAYGRALGGMASEVLSSGILWQDRLGPVQAYASEAVRVGLSQVFPGINGLILGHGGNMHGEWPFLPRQRLILGGRLANEVDTSSLGRSLDNYHGSLRWSAEPIQTVTTDLEVSQSWMNQRNARFPELAQVQADTRAEGRAQGAIAAHFIVRGAFGLVYTTSPQQQGTGRHFYTTAGASLLPFPGAFVTSDLTFFALAQGAWDRTQLQWRTNAGLRLRRMILTAQLVVSFEDQLGRPVQRTALWATATRRFEFGG